MKIKLTIAALLIIALYACTTNITAAQSPEPLNWMYAATKCTGLSLANIQTDYQTFVTQYGWQHGLVTPQQWKASYTDGVNEYARSFGCPDFLNVEGTALTTWQQIYSPVYRRASGRGEIP